MLPELWAEQMQMVARDRRTFGNVTIAIIFGLALIAGSASLAVSRTIPRSVEAMRATAAPEEPAGEPSPMDELLQSMKRDRAISPLQVASSQIASSGQPSRPFVYAGALEDRTRAMTCLATAAWYEAGDDPAGQRAVIQVVLNRVRHPAFPNSICAVVFQGQERDTGCQFSFTCDGSLMRRSPSAADWTRAIALSREALNGAVDQQVRQATHFHANYVAPEWGTQLQRVSQVGAHIFYKWAGSKGALDQINAGYVPEKMSLALSTPSVRGAGSDPDESSARIEPDQGIFLQDGPARNGPGLDAGGVPALAAGKSSVQLMAVDPAGPAGRWALSAMERCAKGKACQVVAYGGAEAVGRNSARRADDMDRPLFLFRRELIRHGIGAVGLRAGQAAKSRAMFAVR